MEDWRRGKARSTASRRAGWNAASEAVQDERVSGSISKVYSPSWKRSMPGAAEKVGRSSVRPAYLYCSPVEQMTSGLPVISCAVPVELCLVL